MQQARKPKVERQSVSFKPGQLDQARKLADAGFGGKVSVLIQRLLDDAWRRYTEKEAA